MNALRMLMRRFAVRVKPLLIFAGLILVQLCASAGEKPFPQLLPQKITNSGPPVMWGKDSVYAVIPRDGGTNMTVEMTAMDSLGNVGIEIVPELRPYLTVSPDKLTNVVAGAKSTLTLKISAGNVAPLGRLAGNIKVRAIVARKGNGRTFPKVLPVVLVIREKEDTIVAPDLDGNGVWDYVDNYINATYPGAENEKLRKGCRQFSRSIQGALMNCQDKDLSIHYGSSSDRAIECISSIRPSNYREIVGGVNASILNTKLRSEAYVIYNEQCAGQVFKSTPRSQRDQSCLEE